MLQTYSEGNPDASFVARELTFGSGESELFESLFSIFFLSVSSCAIKNIKSLVACIGRY